MDQPATPHMPSSGGDAANSYAEISAQEASHRPSYLAPVGGADDTYDEIGIAAAMPPPIGTVHAGGGSNGGSFDVPSYAEMSPFVGEATYDSVGIAAASNVSGV